MNGQGIPLLQVRKENICCKTFHEKAFRHDNTSYVTALVEVTLFFALTIFVVNRSSVLMRGLLETNKASAHAYTIMHGTRTGPKLYMETTTCSGDGRVDFSLLKMTGRIWCSWPAKFIFELAAESSPPLTCEYDGINACLRVDTSKFAGTFSRVSVSWHMKV